MTSRSFGGNKQSGWRKNYRRGNELQKECSEFFLKIQTNKIIKSVKKKSTHKKQINEIAVNNFYLNLVMPVEESQEINERFPVLLQICQLSV